GGAAKAGRGAPPTSAGQRQPQGHAQRTRLSTQRIINEWDYLRQRIVLKDVTAQLFSVRLKSPPELVALVEEFRATIENYLAKRDPIGMARSLPGLPPLRADFLVVDVVKKLDDLDAKRGAGF